MVEDALYHKEKSKNSITLKIIEKINKIKSLSLAIIGKKEQIIHEPSLYYDGCIWCLIFFITLMKFPLSTLSLSVSLKVELCCQFPELLHALLPQFFQEHLSR